MRLMRFAKFQASLPVARRSLPDRQLSHIKLATFARRVLLRSALRVPQSPLSPIPTSAPPTSEFPTPTAHRTCSCSASAPRPCRRGAASWRKCRTCGPAGTTRPTRPGRRSRRRSTIRRRFRDPAVPPRSGARRREHRVGKFHRVPAPRATRPASIRKAAGDSCGPRLFLTGSSNRRPRSSASFADSQTTGAMAENSASSRVATRPPAGPFSRAKATMAVFVRTASSASLTRK